MRLNHLTKLVLSMAALVLLSSCGEKNDKRRRIDAADVQSNKNLTSSQKAEDLAKAAEQLISVQGFAYADQVADLALQQDSSNVRAQFVKVILRPIMVNEGIAKRIKPLTSLDSEAATNYNQAMIDLEEKVPNSTFKTFVRNGIEDIKTEDDIQNYIDSMADSFKAIRLFAKNNKKSELTVMTTDGMIQAMINRHGQLCETTEVSNYVYETNCPSTVNALEVKLNRADFEGLQALAAGFELYFSIYNSYNLDGAIEKALSVKGQENVDGQALINALLENKKFATLRKGNGFSRIKEMGVDAISGARWTIQNQKTLCSMGESSGKNRPGMLFNEGLCADRSAAEIEKGLTETEEALNGKTSALTVTIERHDSATEQYTIMTKPVALIDSPIADLRAITPSAYDKCGNALAIHDPSLSGLLVNKDANVILAKAANCDKK